MAAEFAVTTASLSSNEEDVISRKIETITLYLNDTSEYFELDRCVDFVVRNGYKKVALQFPDELLTYAFEVASSIKEKSGQYVFVLGDTSYGSCCVDEIASEHLNADCIIHFGKSCLSRTSRLPVLYIFGKDDISIQNCVYNLENCIEDNEVHCIVYYDLLFSHVSDLLYSSLKTKFPNMILSKLCMDSSQEYTPPRLEGTSGTVKQSCGTKSDGSCCDCESNSRPSEPVVNKYKHVHPSESETSKIHCRFGRYVQLPSSKNFEDYVIVYIGREDLTLRNFMMSYNKNPFYSYNPYTRVARQETLNVNRSLMKRYYLIQKAKQAKVVGIVLGTLGVANYLSILSRVKAMLKQAGKKYYTFVVGKLNVAKLANFMEVDIYVLVACPQNSLIDSQEFYKPVVTPFEMEVACLRSREWTGDYITDFTELLPGSAMYVDLEQEIKDEEPEYSLLTGTLLSNTSESLDVKVSSALIEKSMDNKVAVFEENSAASFLTSRSWQGLGKNVGQTPVETAKEGRSGIAASYTHEPSQTR